MPEHHLNIISFEVPYPANYGGVIDVYHKIRMLHAAGIKIHLHCFTSTRSKSPELESLCCEVFYYNRKTALPSALWWKPYIVYSRRSNELLTRLLANDYPILFEGLHTCFYLDHPELKNRFKLYRESNIEHDYYLHLYKAEKKMAKKIYFLASSVKLRLFQPILRHANLMLTVSKEDNAYLQKQFPSNKVVYLPSFHAEDHVHSITGKGTYCLYQGNLSVAENHQAATYLVNDVFKGFSHSLIIAGLNPSNELIALCKDHPNVQLIANPSHAEMTKLIREAHINILVTFQPTGLKLKLLNALFNGRFCLVNPEMVTGTELAPVCELATSAKRFRRQIGALMQGEFSEAHLVKRKELLDQWHSNQKNCQTLLNLVYL